MKKLQVLSRIVVVSLLLKEILVAASDLSPTLPFGDVNVLVLTDVHSWVGGHRHKEPELNADYGDVLSFYEMLKGHCQKHGHDLWFVMNGDWIDGTGLATNGDPSHLIPILEKMPWDAVNVGNHELYQKSVIEYMTRPAGLVQFFGEAFLSSNVMLTRTMEPMGHPYRILRGKNAAVMTFGFLYNMDNNDDAATVQTVEYVMEEAWFRKALLEEEFDAILVLAHMGVRDDLVNVILSKIRDELGDNMPVQFITGHTHHRDYERMDNHSASFEAGRYLDTVGFCSFPNRTTVEAVGANATDLFKFEYIDPNVDMLKATLGASTLQTAHGKALSTFIDTVQKDLGLEEIIACADQSYFANRSLYDGDSLWRLFRKHVVPSQFTAERLVFLGKGSWRYDLPSAGPLRIDDVLAISPFNSTLYEWRGIPREHIVTLNATMNPPNTSDPFLPFLPDYVLAPAAPFNVNNESVYSLVTDAFEVPRIQAVLSEIYPDVPSAVALEDGITTTTIWEDFLRSEWKCAGDITTNDVQSTKSSHHQKSGTSVTAVPDPERDRLQVLLIMVAIAIVFLLASIHVRQRGALHRRVLERRDRLTFEALREYEGNDESANEVVEDDSDQGSEGQFV